MLSLRHPLCGVEGCCHTTLSLSFLAQAFSGLGATLSLIKCLAPSLQWKRRIWTVQPYGLSSSSCNANTCGDTWRDKANVRKEREKVVAPSTTSSFDTYRCTGTGAEGCSAWRVGITKYLPKDSEYHYLYSATCFVLCSTIFKTLKNWARVFRKRNLKLELRLDAGISQWWLLHAQKLSQVACLCLNTNLAAQVCASISETLVWWAHFHHMQNPSPACLLASDSVSCQLALCSDELHAILSEPAINFHCDFSSWAD